MTELEKIDELLEQISDLPPTHTKLLLLKETAKIADFIKDIDLGQYIRKNIVEVGLKSGDPLDAIAAFSWLLSMKDQYPEDFDDDNYILWQYKWILEHIDNFPEISLSKIEDMFEDMNVRYLREELSLRPYYNLQCRMHMRMGNKDLATSCYHKWMDTPKDEGSDCYACDVDSQAEFLIFSGMYEKAIEVAAPILNQKIKCSEIPHLTFPRFLLPLLELGDYQRAELLHEKGYKLVSKTIGFMPSISSHMLYLALTHTDKALSLFEKHFSWAFYSINTYHRFLFYLSSLVLFSRLEKTGVRSVSISLQKECDIFEKENLEDLSSVVVWFKKATLDLATVFNNRNGSDFMNQFVDDRLKLIDRTF
ncbi:hypothetical protein QLX67_12215 [Balneolaceae bacterium ANBcel3]|nr:hypothetical protein [Balneolaceae bacterium ANBcel3]